MNRLYEKVLLERYKNSVYLYGAGNVGKKIYGKLKEMGVFIKGFLDKNENIQNCCGCSVETIENFTGNMDGLIIIALSNLTHCYSVRKDLRENGFKNIIDFTELRFWDQFMSAGDSILAGLAMDERTYLERKNDISLICDSLGDEESRQCYQELINFFLGCDDKEFTCHPVVEQYFAYDIYKKIDNESFVDCGAYIGDTMQIFLQNNQERFTDYFAIEPDAENGKRLLQSIKDREYKEKVHLIAAALAAQEGVAEFLSFGTSYSNIEQCPSGGRDCSDKIEKTNNNVHPLKRVKVNVKPLDDIVEDHRISFIKMDIEGFELKALKGAKKTIIKNQPVLAICLYHHAEDMWEIPLYIKSLCDEYTFYFRNYMGIIEYVLYAVPKNRLVE